LGGGYNYINMIRKFGKTENYKEVVELTHDRVDINFDLVYYKDEEGKEQKEYGYWSKHSYFTRPTTEQMQEDVKDYTIQRYINEGLTPPAREDIDVSAYVID